MISTWTRSTTIKHGSASELNFVLSPRLGGLFLANCQNFLSSPFMVAEKSNPTFGNAARFRSDLESLPASLGIKGAGENAWTSMVRSNATSTACLVCQLSRWSADSGRQESISDDCSAGADRTGELKMCGIVSPFSFLLSPSPASSLSLPLSLPNSRLIMPYLFSSSVSRLRTALLVRLSFLPRSSISIAGQN